MPTTYFKTAWRNILKHKGFSFINIFGLSAGLAAFGFIAFYVTDELSYDRYHKNAGRIFRVVQHGSWNGGSFDLAVTSAPYAAALKNDYREVVDAVRINIEGGGKISYENKQLRVNDIFFADNSVFNIFSYTFLYGDPKTALANPQSIVLTKSLAISLFGDASLALNKTVLFGGNFPNNVSGVIDDVPKNSHFSFSALRSFDTNYSSGWGEASLYTYLLLEDESDGAKLESQSSHFYNKYLKSELGDLNYQLELQPLTSIHLRSRLNYEIGNNGSITYIYVFTIVGLLILIMAVINYINLTTARSSTRVKEIGIRKVIGSGRKSLVLMFLSESILLTLIAAIAGALIIYMLLPYFNQISGKDLSFDKADIIKTGITATAFAVITGILSGLYPTLFLSGFRTIPAMKGQLGSQSGTMLFRQSLVTFQFVITITMIAGSLIIYRQLDYVLNKDLGFNKAQTLTFHIDNNNVRNQVGSVKNQLLKGPGIEAVGIAGNPIGNNDLGTTVFNLDASGNSGADSKIVQSLLVDEDFITTMQIMVLTGRNFSEAIATDRTDAIIINETLAKELGWPDPVGRKVRTGVMDGKVINKTVIGVVKDFNTYSLQHKVSPVVLSMPSDANDQDNLYVRLSSSNVKESLSYITSTFAEFDAENKPDFHFLDKNFAAQYQSEEKQGMLLMIFTGLAIMIAALGLLGLVTLAARQRTREIGIRKVLGATIGSLTLLLSKDLIKLVLISIAISVPIAFWTMQKWLNNFAYRTDISWWVFALAGALAIVIALIPVGFQAIKAALENPVKSLRAEL